MSPLTLTILALASHALVAVQAVVIERADIDTKAFCADELNDEALTTAQISELASSVDQHQECSPVVQVVVQQMADVVEATRDNVCDLDAIAALKQLHQNHMATALVEGSVPRALERFFLSYALRMSQRCKDRMVEALSGDAYEALEADDFKSLHDWTSKGEKLDDLMSVVTRPGTLVLPSDLAAILPGMNEQINKLAINSMVDKEVLMVKNICERRFTPVYKKLVEPVAELARAGFDYPDKEVTDKLSKEQIEKVDEWARIVFTCEVLNMVETFKESAEGVKPESITIVDKDSIEDIEDKLDNGERVNVDLEPVNYEPREAAVRMGQYEEVAESELNKLASDLASHSNPVELMKQNLRNKAIEMITPYLQKGDLNSMVTCLSSAKSPHEKTLCGRGGGGCGQMFVYLLFAGIISFMMMLIAGGD